MSLKYVSLLYLCCAITFSAYAESDSASYAALQMRLLLSDQQAEESLPVATADIEANEIQGCADKIEKVHSLLAFIPSTDKLNSPEAKHALNELLQLSKSSDFDPACSDWLYDILLHFNAVKLKHTGYKNYLYAVLAKNKGKEAGVLVVAALQYSLLQGALTDEEWQLLKAALRYSSHQDLKQVIALISQATVIKVQSEQIFNAQLDDLMLLAKAGELGRPLTIKPNYVIGLILANSQRDFPDQFMLMYRKYHAGIDKPARLERYIRTYISASPSTERYSLLTLYLKDIYSSDVKLNKRDANKLFAMLQKLRPIHSAEDSELMVIWHDIMADNEQIISAILQHSSVKAAEKTYWFNFYAKNDSKVTQIPL